jgi:superfamily II DNA helicase RecQ
MRLKFFWVPAMDSVAAEQEVDGFLTSHQVVQVERIFHPSATQPGWALCFQWLPGPEASGGRTGTAGRPEKVDYQVVLDIPTFQIFAALRTWRKANAAAAGVPVYTVASNEQLAEIARRRVQTRAALEQIEGFGNSRIKQYADEVVGVCCREIAALPAGVPPKA